MLNHFSKQKWCVALNLVLYTCAHYSNSISSNSSDESEDECDSAADSLRILGDASLPTRDTAKEKAESHVMHRADILPCQVQSFTSHDVDQAFSHFS